LGLIGTNDRERALHAISRIDERREIVPPSREQGRHAGSFLRSLKWNALVFSRRINTDGGELTG